MEATITPPTESDAKVVEGSDGLLLEVDGRILPNYDATSVQKGGMPVRKQPTLDCLVAC